MTNNDLVKEFLGVGWKFPISIDETTGRIRTSSYEEDVAEAIRIIMMTRKGERVMQPEFGCGIQDYVFQTIDYTTISQMEHTILEALIIWEPRIIEPEVHIKIDEIEAGKLNIHISYTVRSTNNPYNLVYPYFINEGIK